MSDLRKGKSGVLGILGVGYYGAGEELSLRR